MKLYVKVYFSPDGISPLEIIRILKEGGFVSVFGQFDFVKEFDSEQEYNDTVTRLYNALKGTGVMFRINTRIE
ncbi:MAG: hypothetical protein ACP5NL_01265 [Thermoplasmata archaeon]